MNSRFNVVDITHNRTSNIYCVYVHDMILNVLIVAEYVCRTPTPSDIKQQLDLFNKEQPSQFYCLGRFAREYTQYADKIAVLLANC